MSQQLQENRECLLPQINHERVELQEVSQELTCTCAGIVRVLEEFGLRRAYRVQEACVGVVVDQDNTSHCGYYYQPGSQLPMSERARTV